MPNSRFDETHKVRDPLHGFIRYNDLERDLINSLPFQRLRWIRQLGNVALAYPGAEHTRFQHSIGVMHTASRIFDLVARVWKDTLGWTDDELFRNRQLLRLGALLHDIGHPPFSHATEGLIGSKRGHQGYSSMIASSSPIRDLIDNNCRPIGFGGEQVGDLIEKQLILPGAAFLNEILGGDIDADKMDYLLRDSLFCGVGYGKYDLEMLLHSLTLREDPVVGNWVMAIQEDGIHAAEGLILARYFMFAQVYFHEVSRIYDYHLSNFLSSVLPGGSYSSDLLEYLDWNDVRVASILHQEARKGNPDAVRIVERDHFREVASTSSHVDEGEDVLWKTMIDGFEARYPRVPHFEDESTKAPHGFEEAEFHVVISATETIPIMERSGLVRALSPIFKRRLYVDNATSQDAEKFCDAHQAKYRSRLRRA